MKFFRGWILIGIKWVLFVVGFGVFLLFSVFVFLFFFDVIVLLLFKVFVFVVLLRLDWVVDFLLLVFLLLSVRFLLVFWRFEREDDCLLLLYNIKYFVFNIEVRKVKLIKKCYFCIKVYKICCIYNIYVFVYYYYNGISRYFL